MLDNNAPTVLAHDNQCEVPAALDKVDRIPLHHGSDGLDLDALLDELTARQCNEILVESGPRLAGALLSAGLVDELVVYMAPVLLGERARPLLGLSLDNMSEKVNLDVKDVRKVGQDWRYTVIPAR